jgi:hypothetical protein
MAQRFRLTERHDITEILLTVALDTINLNQTIESFEEVYLSYNVVISDHDRN